MRKCRNCGAAYEARCSYCGRDNAGRMEQARRIIARIRPGGRAEAICNPFYDPDAWKRLGSP